MSDAFDVLLVALSLGHDVGLYSFISDSHQRYKYE